METKKFRALVKQLRVSFPVSVPVRVRRSQAKKNCGNTTFDGGCYRIRIQSNQSTVSQIDTLLHEWAHVCAMEAAYRHEASWALLFGQIYNAWTKDFKEPIIE